MNQILVDVREHDEYAAEHIPESIWLPLSQINKMAPAPFQKLPAADITHPVSQWAAGKNRGITIQTDGIFG